MNQAEQYLNAVSEVKANRMVFRQRMKEKWYGIKLLKIRKQWLTDQGRVIREKGS